LQLSAASFTAGLDCPLVRPQTEFSKLRITGRIAGAALEFAVFGNLVPGFWDILGGGKVWRGGLAVDLLGELESSSMPAL